MRIGIHHRAGSFSDAWIAYCRTHGISFKIIDCYRSDVVEQLADCDGLMWHWAHYDHKAVLFARQLTYSLEAMGKRVFPDSRTCWHFDDKVGQKYLLQAVGAPLVPSYVFYDREEALAWMEETDFPMVLKLRCGAGSMNVMLVRTKQEAAKLIHRAFGRGFSPANRPALLRDKLGAFSRHRNVKGLTQVAKAAIRCVVPGKMEKSMPREKGYVYFQDFVPNAQCDIRAVVIGDRCFAIRRRVRNGEFRASGSGLIEFDRRLIDERCVATAFSVARKIESQCLACDFVVDGQRGPRLLEISYAFSHEAYKPCPGFWDSQLTWHECEFAAPDFMIEDFILSAELPNIR